jgi:hypothetical protein
MMRNLGGVKSIMLGGRPTNQPIQAIGGVKGAQSLGFDSIFSIAQPFLSTTISSTAPGIDNTPLTEPQSSALKQLSELPMKRSLDNGINFSDQILKGNLQDGVPAQFVRENADCRVFYTPSMVVTGGAGQGVEAMWEAAADVAWRGKACVVGGISNGMVSAREAPSADVVQMAQVADDARKYLEEVQMKAVMDPPEKCAGWDERMGKGVPAMHMG